MFRPQHLKSAPPSICLHAFQQLNMGVQKHYKQRLALIARYGTTTNAGALSESTMWVRSPVCPTRVLSMSRQPSRSLGRAADDIRPAASLKQSNMLGRVCYHSYQLRRVVRLR